ncbi:uncharacterized protein LOC101845560 [Aplysia californica]|uniref:Uncharacterized protein LOC101845560 n=2 Tax=Aplysia californica TaxID=6500 RepID=A0ABM1VVX4_APLCA|nr:uncharacterized protein LOC101845560 [Aplysia californica]
MSVLYDVMWANGRKHLNLPTQLVFSFQENRPVCQPRLDLPNCAEPCISSPCLNNGECISSSADLDVSAFHCQCPPPYDGSTCEIRQNPCAWPVDPGSCDQEIVRYYYDKMSHNCLPFMFSGCGGNVNNYHTLEECTTIALRGACCYRTYRTNIEDVVRSTQELEIKCQVRELHMVECKSLHRQPSGDDSETEVISFNPGLTCAEAACQTVGTCVVGQRVYQEGETFTLGCQDCSCQAMGQVKCSSLLFSGFYQVIRLHFCILTHRCEKQSVRREIRDMTREELLRFQNAVARLRQSEDRTWEQFRDMYMYHVMHASGGTFFLPWHRMFLRQVEQRLQEIDCNVVLPYFDFTTDIGFFEEAIIWQPNYFGSNGDGGCVEDHPFGPKNSWSPCFVRNFNTSIRIPNKVELLIALASDDYNDMSLCLETYIAYLHNFIGGDMVTSSSPYDPVFFALHAYVDMLYWTWQQRGENKFKFPAAFGNIPMIPFNIPPWAVFDSEADLCVTYALPSKGHPCNTTKIAPKRPKPGIRRGDTDPNEVYGLDGYDPFGYSEDGYDRKGMDPYGFGRNGFSRDGYNSQGYDIGGFNRYGFNAEGYDRYGFNVAGVDAQGNRDTTGRFDFEGYDIDCFNREGESLSSVPCHAFFSSHQPVFSTSVSARFRLTRQGLDQYGFYKTGVDKDGCSFYFQGPFSPIHSYRLHSVLVRQPKSFLMSLARTCTGLSPLPGNWLDLNWVSTTKDVTAMVPVKLPDMQTGVSSRFCFNTRMFLTSCECDADLAVCDENPCAGAVCKAFPEAECRISFCGACVAKWFHEGKEVDCELDRDHCAPNPCQNGGTCQPSIWPHEPHLITCQCPPGFEGPLCQYTALDPCSLPLSTGSCSSRESRWYFNQLSGRCQKFTYLGCHGNANNFASIFECQERCIKGSCCTRTPKIRSQNIGFDSQGYDKYGFNQEGLNRFGDRRNVDNSFPLSTRRFDESGLDWQGYNREGYGEDGLSRAGFDKYGFDVDGFNISGYSRSGEFDGIIDYDEEGYDPEGFNRIGLSCHGNDRMGLDLYGVSGAYSYSCDITTLSRCQERAREGEEVVKFTLGKTCQESGCGEPCGCRHGNKTFSIYEQFQLGCQTCSCTEKGVILCVCDFAVKRKEIREMSRDELDRYQSAVRRLTQNTGYPSQWFEFASVYASYKPQAAGSPLFLPWNRQFLRNMEQAIQNIDCGVAIPYYDWTVDAGKPHQSSIWAANVMGGNGGEQDCVRYHPFKSYHPPYLSPCLRRRFNTSVSLPSVVNVELALREPSYDRFRLQVEIFARVYQSFVGGHMASDFAPYDPLFYSLMATVDKLWTDWQDRHKEGMLSFPLDYRYVRLDPFKTTPDDVFDSRIQLCVDYFPLTEGVPCNITEVRTYGYNSQGYDRHGFNREGYDRDGYNIRGYDVSGNLDDRNIYNIDGYDREGFNRSGFDDSGIDRFGFFTDTYNLDEFDPLGFDRSGYNRYGYNQQGFTPYGLHANGSYLPNINIEDLNIFDPYGYNKYGYDKQGFDRNGFDVFGFDRRGFDNRICNYYYIGPIHILVKRYIAKTIKDMNVTILTKVKRVCPELSSLPVQTRRQQWLNRGGQRSQIDDVHRYQVEGHTVDTMFMPRETSVTTDLVWLPIAPDERLCLVTEVYTNCQLGQPQVMCPGDLCGGRATQMRCAESTTAAPVGESGMMETVEDDCNVLVVWMRANRRDMKERDGHVHHARRVPVRMERLAAELWNGLALPVVIPGMLQDQCCPSCDGCDYKGQVVLSGSDFRIPGDLCSRCRCENGNVACSKVECPDLGECSSVSQTDGQCCPGVVTTKDKSSCQEVISASLAIFVPDVAVRMAMWRAQKWNVLTSGNAAPSARQTVSAVQSVRTAGPANTVLDGSRANVRTVFAREAKLSAALRCVKYRPVTIRTRHQGSAVHSARVSSCLYQGKVYREGAEFSPEPCSSCVCERGNAVCSVVDCAEVTCSNPVTPIGQCCPACGLDCEYDGRKYRDKSVFNPVYNPCLNCTCSNSIVRCRTVHCSQSDVPCSSPVRKPGECCPTLCPTCEDQGVDYLEGDTWPSHNSACDICQCRSGKVVCEPGADCPRRCSHGVVRPGDCCSLCTDCLFEGRVVPEGETLTVAGETCRQCSCRDGSMSCRSVSVARECPRLRCERTETLPGNCCPVCKGCTYKDEKFRHGDLVSQDQCSRCLCDQGEVLCDSQEDRCPTPKCSNPRFREGLCCPVCDDCVHYGQEYRDGDRFTSLQDPCQKCVCQSGQVSCNSIPEECPPVTCTHPARQRDQCCSTCDACLYQRRVMRNGQRFAGSDLCQICTCKRGSVTCSRKECPLVRCSNPTMPPGQCCPVCDNKCTFEGREYREGQSFPRPGADCSVCVCKDGQISCERPECERLTCTHPAQLPGECCPKCNFCLYQNRIFRNQQGFVHPRDVCQQCICAFGTVTCTRTICEDLNCRNPMPMAGSCCPVCPKQCSVGGLSYDDGVTFVNPAAKCEDCLCRQGSVHCKRRMCPQVTCANPAQDGCCPVCSDCSYLGLILQNGESAPDPQDPCQSCSCSQGSVRCRSVTCPPVTCSNPVMVGCCPSCTECEYRGRRYENGAVIAAADRCRTCICQDGNMECQSNPCPAVSCRHPSRGQCCDECVDCLYQGLRYRSGQRFQDPSGSSCQECVCSKGDVVCSPMSCPPALCSHPVQGRCCKECNNCFFDGRTVREGAYAPSPSNPCEECVCRQGSMSCRRKVCQSGGQCRHPVERGCCKECTDCLYQGREYRNGQDFSDPATPCVTCRCAYGEVTCERRTCPTVSCSHPVQRGCCKECGNGCFYNSRTYSSNQRFPHPTDRCKECVCSGGNVRCSAVDCSGAGLCSHPMSVPGECCPVCGRGCLYEGQVIPNGERFDRNCQDCTCRGGNIRCTPRQCPEVSCSNPVVDGCCQTCDNCLLDGVRYRNGQTFPDARRPCNECYCRDGSVSCEKKACPLARCTHPATGECCPECLDCDYDGRSYRNGQRFTNQTDFCSQCVCEYGSVSCIKQRCSPASCSHPITDQCGCPACSACTYQGKKVAEGERFASAENECQECLCRGGTVSCSNKPCTETCTHPASVRECCPLCEGCLYEGRVIGNGQSFVSDVDPCQKCRCLRGSVVCESLICPDVPCLNPVTVSGECCPTCALCQFQGQRYTDNQRFEHPNDDCQTCTCKMGRVECEEVKCVVTCTHPRQDNMCCPPCDDCLFEGDVYLNGVGFRPDPCHSCTCQNGNVRCEEQVCPRLPCAQVKRVEGLCCEVCQGCTFRGILYDDNASWLMQDNPCITCTCNAGLVTCMETECFVPCSNPVTVPGQCCPVCPTCNYDGRLYGDGDEFTPNGDPCDSCFCEDGHLRCLHNTCPSVANCPAGSLRDPVPGSCCPTCDESFSTGCTIEDLGKITRPRPNDPCFFCECKEDFMWVCMKEQCKALTCPPDVQEYIAGQCCPSCPACYDLSEAKYYREGSEWTAVEDPCIACVCKNAEIKCSIQSCEPISCASTERVVIPEGQCCEMCQPVPDATCLYQARTYQPGEEWTVDECTNCRCLGGRVTCNVKRCPTVDCAKDEAPVTTPGQCCPVCQKRPGTCLVFGDPHYRTFDGATLHFQGTCRYLMAADCENDVFRVEVQHDNRGAPGEVSWAQNLTVTVAGAVVDLLQGRDVLVNGRRVDLPYLYEPHLLIEESSRTLLLSTEIGVQVVWDGSSYGELTVPGSFKRKLCGLCGNFNGFPQDDLRTKSGQITNSPATFGNSWKTKEQSGGACVDAKDINPCVAAGYRIRKQATTRCAILKGAPFTRCHRVISPEPFFSSCVYDLCVCMDDPNCLCDIIATYAHECARAGVKVEWRSQNLCAFECDSSKGLVFDECGPVCPRTCEQAQAAGQLNVTETCFKPCVASCQCTADKVFHNGRCIAPADCPYIETVPST